MNWEFMILSCKNFINFFEKPCREAEPNCVYKDLSVNLYIFILCEKQKESFCPLNITHLYAWALAYGHALKVETEDVSQRGIVLCFYILEACMLVCFCCVRFFGFVFFFLFLKLFLPFEICFLKHTVFQHKSANLYHFSQILLQCRSVGLQPQAAPRDHYHGACLTFILLQRQRKTLEV